MIRRLFATKPLQLLQAETYTSVGFHRALTAWDLTLLGIGVVIGTGVFVLTGHAAAANAGPAVCLSFAIAAVAATLGALCYAEMVSMIPVAGSAYTYAYATLGEVVAFVIGWDLILEYMVGAATVSVGWSGYVVALIEHVSGIRLPSRWTTAPWAWNAVTSTPERTGAAVNLPAVLIVLFLTVSLIKGVEISSRLNSKLVVLKLGVIVLFVAAASRFIQPHNWHPFIPPNTGSFGHFGWSGVFQGASMVFFAYLGVDNLSTIAQEARQPQRTIPIAIVATLAVCTTLYMAVCLVLTGVVPYEKLSVPHPMAVGIATTGLGWLESVVELGAVAGLTSVMLVQLLGQPRIFFAMARDGLLPGSLAKIHPVYGTPYITTAVTGSLCALGGGLLPIDILGELTSIGTLFAFLLVSLGVMVLRIKHPRLPRAFKVPGGPYGIPVLSALVCIFLMASSTFHTLLRLGFWILIGLGVYFSYGRKHTRLPYHFSSKNLS